MNKNYNKKEAPASDNSGSLPLFNNIKAHFTEKFGTKVIKLPLFSGMSCPNRDGTLSDRGCTFCPETGSGSHHIDFTIPLEEQLKKGIEAIRAKDATAMILPYLQPYTNTNADSRVLEDIYTTCLTYPGSAGLCIGTRPDCLCDEVTELIGSLSRNHYIWVEIGVQSMHKKSLEQLNRNHCWEDCVESIQRLRSYPVFICAHTIVGIPGEDRDDILETHTSLSRLGIHGLKIHLLHVIKDTFLEKLYREGKLSILDKETYVSIVCDILERISPDIIIQRLTGEAHPSTHIAPEWALNKSDVLNAIRAELTARGTRQGIFSSLKSPCILLV